MRRKMRTCTHIQDTAFSLSLSHVFFLLQETFILIFWPRLGVPLCSLSWSTVTQASGMLIILTSSYPVPPASIHSVMSPRWRETQVGFFFGWSNFFITYYSFISKDIKTHLYFSNLFHHYIWVGSGLNKCIRAYTRCYCCLELLLQQAYSMTELFSNNVIFIDNSNPHSSIITELMFFLVFFHLKRQKYIFYFSILFHHYIWGYPVLMSVFMRIPEVIVLWSCRKHNRWLSCIVTINNS